MLQFVRSVLQLFFLTILLSACSSAPTNPGTPSTPEPPEEPIVQLDCEREGYPCSLAEVPDFVLQATADALQGAFDARKAGSMDSARAYLEALPNVVEVGGDETALRFRLEGGSPAWFIDRSATTTPATLTSSFSIAEQAPGDLYALTPQAVVGEDQNQDGRVNNRDPKKALVLAPYLWEFAPDDESPLLAERLNLIPDYEGNVMYKSNPAKEDQNITIEDYWSWDEYDAIFISTHGTRACWRPNECGVVISSGVRWNVNDRPPVATGALMAGKYDEEAMQSNVFVELGLALDFFRSAYAGSLDDALVSFSACETGASGASELAAAIGRSNFVMMGWTENVTFSGAFNALGLFQEKLDQGLPAKEALRLVREAGLSPIPNGDGIMTDFTHFAPGGGDLRIREVITLLDPDGHPLEDGTGLTGMVDGIPGDGQKDLLDLTVQVDGVLPDERAEFEVSFELDGKPLAKTSDLTKAENIGGEYSYRLTVEDVPVGSDLEPGHSFELEAVVSLPEGGESRYVVTAKLVAWSMTVSGSDFAGTYEGTHAHAEDPNEPADDNSTFLSLWSGESDGEDDAVHVSFSSTVSCHSGEFPQGTGTYYLTTTFGQYGCGDDAMITFNGLATAGSGFGSGHGEVVSGYEHCGPLPEPAVLTITTYNEDFIQGTIDGTFWVLDGDTGCWKTISAFVEFTAIREMYQPF